MIHRFYQKLGNYLKPNNVLVIYGPRQVGKTTLLKNFLSKTNLKYKLDSGENIRTQQILSSQNFSQIFDYVSGYQLIAVDEAQHIPNVGQGLKIIVDNVPRIMIIATGSSSFELSGQIGEPLTGRKKTLTLFPVALLELSMIYNPYEINEKLSELLVFGSYPKVLTAKNKNEKIEVLEELAHSYLLKDILEFERIKSSKILLDLIRSLAFQIGNEVSLSELSGKIGVDYKTVARYLDILEKTFVIINIRGFSRNLRKEITKKSKYYFYDIGIRNAIVSNFNELDIRDDCGKLWENFLVVERLKTQSYLNIISNNYFWRTWDQKEIDWIEERQGQIFGYEFKFSKKKKEKIKIPKEFLSAYPGAQVKVIHPENYHDFLLPGRI
ncbi:MAG: ATP-binding protein [Candidatus Omnitrophica bacterium]|nr:ATP-binding protein [Candidatus Omnitrophota bacterium]